MAGLFAFSLIVAFSLIGAWGAARRQRGVAARLTVLGVVGFALVVLAAQLVAVLAAATRRPLLTPWSIALAVLVLAGIAWGVGWKLAAPARDEGDGDEGSNRLGTGILLAGVLGLAFLANGAIVGLSGPPRGWDVMTYHLPRAVAWLQHGNLGHYGFSPAYYPGNGELAMFVTLFTGTDRLTTVAQFPFALLGAVALFGLAREIGASRRSAAAALLAFILTPMVLFQAGTAKNDLIIAATTLAGVFMLVRALRRRWSTTERRFALAVGGLAFGLAIGTKYTALPFVVAVVPLVAVAMVALHGAPSAGRWSNALRSREAWSSAMRDASIFAASILLPSAFWFAQNWIMAGNPFAPVSVKLGELVVFPGIDVGATFGHQQFQYVPRIWSWWFVPWYDRALMGSYSNSIGFGAVFAAFFAPAMVLLTRRSISRRGGHDRLRASVLLALIVMGVGVWWLGGFHLPRYLWPVLALMYAPVALLFDEVAAKARAVLVGVFVLAAAFSCVETMRIIHGDTHFQASCLPRGITKEEFYSMPGTVYELPPGTRILLYEPTEEAYHRTFRYPLVGDLPGNDVIMVGDVGVELEEAMNDTALLHDALLREGVEYIFSRTLLSQPRRCRFDLAPNRYEKLIDDIKRPYPWYRYSVVQEHDDGAVVGLPVVTKLYRVLSGPEGRRVPESPPEH